MKKIIKSVLTRIRYCQNCEKIFNCKLNNEKVLTEILMAQVFHDSMVDISWLKSKNFSPRGAAANYSFLYVLLRVLNEFQPTNILKLGIGQTTKLPTQYVLYGNDQEQLLFVEHDESWVDFFEKVMPKNNRVRLLKLKIDTLEFKNYLVSVYKDLMKNVETQKFDYLVIDGPLGSDRYSGSGILGVIEKQLKERFVILIDDVYNRRC